MLASNRASVAAQASIKVSKDLISDKEANDATQKFSSLVTQVMISAMNTASFLGLKIEFSKIATI